MEIVDQTLSTAQQRATLPEFVDFEKISIERWEAIKVRRLQDLKDWNRGLKKIRAQKWNKISR
jgi:hypothetical protein